MEKNTLKHQLKEKLKKEHVKHVFSLAFKWVRKNLFKVLFVLALIAFFINRNGNGQEAYEFFEVKRGAVTQQVFVSGNVEPIESVDLAFEVSGRVKEVVRDVSEPAERGEALVTLELGELAGELSQAQAGVDLEVARLNQFSGAVATEQARLDELRRGTRPEEISLAQTNFDNADVELENAERNLESVKSKTEADLNEDYSSALTTANSASQVAKNAILTITEIQQKYHSNYDFEALPIRNAKKVAVKALFDVPNVELNTLQFVSQLSGGVYSEVKTLTVDDDGEAIIASLKELLEAVKLTKLAVDSIPLKTEYTDAEDTEIATTKTDLNTEISSISSSIDAIEVQKKANDTAVITAESDLAKAENTKSAAEDELKLKKAGSTPEEIRAQEGRVATELANLSAQRAQVRQAQGNLENVQAKIAKRTLVAPISGVVTKQDAKVGEIISPNVVLVSVITETNYEIEANVPEVDIAKVNVGNEAMMVLDAYGPEEFFPARVVEIEPADTIVDGVPSYKVTFEFTEDDEKLRPGLTADITVETARKENVLKIPVRTVKREDGETFVRLLKDMEGKTPLIERRLIQTGLLGGDGMIEVLSGLDEGERIIIE